MLTQKVIAYTGKLHQVLEFWMSQDFARYCILSGVLDDALRLALAIGLDGDHTGREAVPELFLVFARNG